jgi:nitroimidazol reductase NimA-like FMN-containing flavoprotein (pyridoxamine 5'-phosphate oxidase superfamily)
LNYQMTGTRKMRRTDREVLEFADIVDILRRSDTIRLGLNGDPYPYVVPLTFGFEVIGGSVIGDSDASGRGVGGVGGDGAEGESDVSGGVAGDSSVSVGVAGDSVDGAVVVYAHCATEGLKLDLIGRDNHVCVETDIFHQYHDRIKNGVGTITTLYESFIGFGTAEIVSGGEAVHGIRLILEHCGYPDFDYEESELSRIKMLRITLPAKAVTGQRNLKK